MRLTLPISVAVAVDYWGKRYLEETQSIVVVLVKDDDPAMP